MVDLPGVCSRPSLVHVLTCATKGMLERAVLHTCGHYVKCHCISNKIFSSVCGLLCKTLPLVSTNERSYIRLPSGWALEVCACVLPLLAVAQPETLKTLAC